METDAIPQRVQEKTEPTDSADLVVGIVAEFDSAVLASMCDALGTLPGTPRVAILQNDPAANSAPASSDVAPRNPQTVPKNDSVFFVPSLLARPDTPGTGLSRAAAIYQAIFAAGQKLQARGCCVVASKLEMVEPRWIYQLAQPLLEPKVDLVLPHYTRRKFQGLLNNSVIAPLIRSLYGKRISNPMGPDLGISRRLVEKMLPADHGAWANGHPLHPLASLTPAALCGNLQVAEAHLGSRIYPAIDWTNISSVLAEVLGPVFLDMERNAACWQRTRFSSFVPTTGEPSLPGEDTGSVEMSRLVESFQLGNRELQEVWGLVLPPSSLFELRKLSRVSVEQFHMPDELWVRIVYDFALAHRLRTINRDHLLRSMTPLYLGWVASYARDLQTATATALERRLERLSVAYETDKPYLVSRWRWPDRFNP